MIGDYMIACGQQPLNYKLGAGFFIIGHVFYLFAFKFFDWEEFKDNIPKLFFTGLVSSLLFTKYNIFMSIIAFIYGCFLMNLFLTSFTILSRNDSDWIWNDVFACVGCIFFMISDFLLALILSERIQNTKTPYFVMSTYYIAQFLIAISTFNKKIPIPN